MDRAFDLQLFALPQYITNTDPGNFQSDGVYIDLISAPPAIQNAGAPTGLVAIVGGGNWGPVNSPTGFTQPSDLFQAFGNDTTSTYSLVRAGLDGMPECAQFLGVRQTDGTDTAATIALLCGGAFASGTLVIGGTPTASDTITATMVNGATTVTTPTYTVSGSPTTAQVATAIAALINASAAVVGNSAFLQPVTVSASTITFTALSPGTAANSITVNGTQTGNHTTVTPSSATALTGGAAASGTFATLTAIYTGSLPNPTSGLDAAVTMSLLSGSFNGSPVLMAQIQFPGFPNENFIFNAYATAGAGYNATAAKANFANAVNGLTANVSGSVRWTATSGSGTQAPALNTTNASGGTDGTASLTTSLLLGVAYEVNSTGLQALAGVVSGGQAFIAGLTDLTASASLISFGVANNVLMHISVPNNTATSAAVASRASNGASSPTLVLSMDFINVLDPTSGTQLQRPPDGKIAGIIAGQPSYQSPGNQPVIGAAGIISTTRVSGGINTVTQSESNSRTSNGIEWVGYMPRTPRGPQLGLPHGMASDGLTPISDTRMLHRIGYEIGAGLGQFVDGMVNPNNVNELTVAAAYDWVDGYFQALLNSPQQIAAYSNPQVNTASSLSKGFLNFNIGVQTLSLARFVVAAIQVGSQVQITVAPATAPT